VAWEISPAEQDEVQVNGDAAMAEGQVPTGKSRHPLIRRYMACDRGIVRRLAVACADRRVVPACLDSNPRLVADVLTRYYVDFEPEACWVADDPGTGVVGYLFGCLSTRRRFRAMASRIIPAIILRTIFAGVAFSCPMGQLAWAGLRSWKSGHAVKSRAALGYPAHLHIGVHPDYRRQGVGRELVLQFVDQARAEGIPGIHASVVEANLPACSLFRSLGFDVLARYEVLFPGSPCAPVRMLLLGLETSSPGDLQRSGSSSRANEGGK
jgi:ribosomal protein S18 acetylase RimI-like enzyme